MSDREFAGYQALALYVLKSLAQHQINGRHVTLQDLVDEIKVRRGDIRKVISTMAEQGYVDPLRMRLTMSGFAIGSSLLDEELPPLRKLKAKLKLVAA